MFLGKMDATPPPECGTLEQNWQLVELGMLPVLLNVLDESHLPMVAAILDGLLNLSIRYQGGPEAFEA